MKKFLALVLALVMTMSLVTISSSAANFTDSEDIKYDEAVNVLSALGVISGKPDGSYAPAETVDRATMAKFIVYIKTGSDGASAYATIPTDLTDIESSWAKNAIKYCYANGIIAGDGQGHFFPTNPVTTVEAAKMLLVALGYKADVQGYVGDQWKVKVTADATDNKIFEGIDVATDKPLTREETAKLVYNTVVLAETINENRSQDLTDGSVSVSYVKSGDNLLGETFSAVRYKGVLDGATYSDYDGTYNYTGTFEDIKDVAVDIDNFTTAEDYTDLRGEEIVVLQKTIDNRDTVLGVYATGATTAEVSVVRDLKVSNGKLVVNGKSYSVNENSVAEGLYNTVKAESHFADYDTVKLTDALKADGSEGADGKLDSVVPFGYTAGKVTFADSKEIIVETEDDNLAIKLEGNDVADGIEKNDYVVYRYLDVTDSYTVTEIAPFEAEASEVKTTNSGVKFDGAWYNKVSTTTFVPGTTYKVWAYNNVIVGDEAVNGDSIEDLVLVYDYKAANGNWNKAGAFYIGVDGKTAEVTVDHKNANDATIYDADETVALYSAGTGTGFLARKNSTSDGVEFYEPKADIGNGTYTYFATVDSIANLADGKVTIDGDVVSIADSAVVLMTDGMGGSAKVITGAKLKKIAGDIDSVIGGYIKDNALGNVDMVSHIAVVYDGATGLGDLTIAGSSDLYAYVTSDATEVKKGSDSYNKFSIWTGKEFKEEVYSKGLNADLVKGAIITYSSIADDGVISDLVVKTADSLAISAVSGKEVIINGTTYEVTGDTQYLYVNSTADTAADIGKAEADEGLTHASTRGGVERDNVAVIFSGTELLLVVVDVAGDMQRADNKYAIDVADCYGITDDVTSVRMADKLSFELEAGTYNVVGLTNSNVTAGVLTVEKAGKVNLWVSERNVQYSLSAN